MRATADREDTGDRKLVGLVVVAVVAAAVLTIVWRRDPSEWPDDVRTVAGMDVADDAVNGVPLRPGAFRVDGDLADGWAVPDGTVLLGDVLPTDRAQPDRSRPGSGWRAYLLVADGADDAVEDLARQADAAGMTPMAGAGCVRPEGDWDEGARACRLAWRGAGGRQLAAELTRGARAGGEDGAVPASLLRLTLTDRAVGGTEDAAADEPGTVVPDGDLPGGWADPPGAGERLAAGSPDPLRLPEGAEAVVAPWPSAAGAAAYGAVAELTGDVDAALDDLAAQLEERTGEPPTAEHATLPGGTVERLVAGGDAYVVTATAVGDRTWLTVEASAG